MLNNFRKRLVATTLLSAAMAFGCDDRPPTAPTIILPPTPTPAAAPTPVPTAMPPRVLGVMPDKVATTVPTVVVLVGHRFHQEATVTFGGTPGNIVRGTETFLMVMTPIHEAGNVEIVVTNPDGLSGHLSGRFIYEVPPAGVPSIESISPTLGVTTGGTWVEIFGTGFHFGSTIKVDGELVRPFLNPTGSLGFATSPHAAGVVDVVVSNPDGEARLRGGFAYAAPETFNFNGEWSGSADGPAETLPDMSFTIANNSLVRISCGSVTLTPSPAPSVPGGEFSFAGADGVALSGRMLSTSTAVGEIRVPPCGPSWVAKKQ